MAACAGCALLAGEGHGERMMQLVVLLHVGLFVLPCAMCACLAAASGALTLLLCLFSLPHWVARRPTGLADLPRQVWQLPAAVLPGYWRALRRVESPMLWGAVAGTAAWLAAWLAAGLGGFAP